MTAKKSAPAKAAPAAAPAKAHKAEAEDKKKPAKAAAVAAKPAAKAVEAKGKPGRKPKAGAAKKEEVPEEDFSDIEADLQGEPEAEAEGGEEKVAKVKPLRMKVSRAKERAQMREFG
jgi:RNA polymerase primary sigma factor